MSNKKLKLARTDTRELISNLRGEVGEVITAWLLMRHYISAAIKLKTGDGDRDFADKNIRFANLMADKLADELVGRLSELAESKIGQLNFHFAARKLGKCAVEAKTFTDYIIRTKIRDKRNRDISHKQLRSFRSKPEYLHIEYKVLVRAVALTLRLMKCIDRFVLGPAAPFSLEGGTKETI